MNMPKRISLTQFSSVYIYQGEETEGTDGQIYKRHLEAILTKIPLTNNLDHLLAR